MKLFVSKLRYKDGDLAHPRTLFADDYASAVKRIENLEPDTFDEIIVREVKPVNAAHFHRNTNAPDDAIIEHVTIEWRE
jgi:hypothetical protein